MKTVAHLAILYGVFATVATLANLGTQVLVVWAYHGPHAIELSVLVGTGTGLPIKYVLEKQHIFEFQSDSLTHDGKLFVLYVFTGVFTTALFWATEFFFQWLFGTDAMRYLGGGLGLTMGYVIKYQLDKRFVFVAKSQPVTGVL
jgi:putative flippase GtrA